LLPRYQRRLREVNEAVVATYLAGGNLRRIRGALRPLLKAAPLSKSAISRILATLKAGLEAWQTRPLADLEIVYLYLDAIALRVRSAGKVSSLPVLGAVAVLADGQKQLLALELCSGESFEAWKGCLDDLAGRGLKGPLLCIIDGNPGLRRAVELRWPTAAVQRCCVHKLRNLERKAPSTRWRRSATTSTGSSMPPVRRPRGRPIRPSSASGPPGVPGWCAACARAATNCSRFSASPKRNGRRCVPRT
jgi:putative transposase